MPWFRADEPLEILGASPDDAPVCFLRINSDWAVLLIGLAEYMLSPGFWDESTGDVDAAIADAARLIDILGGCMSDQVAIFSLERPPGSHGGTSVAQGYQYRDLTLCEVAQPWAALDSGGVLLQPGVYHLSGKATCCGVLYTRLTIESSDFVPVHWRGGNFLAQYPAAAPVTAWPTVEAVITVYQPTRYRLKHYTYSSVATLGLGVSVPDGYAGKYAYLSITRLPS